MSCILFASVFLCATPLVGAQQVATPPSASVLTAVSDNPSVSSGIAPVVAPATPVPSSVLEVAPMSPPSVPGAKTPDDVQASDIPGLVAATIGAIRNKNWALLTGALIMLVTFFLNLFWLHQFPKEQLKVVLPWVTVGAGFLLQFAACLLAGDAWLQAINTAFLTGATASGLWSLAGKLALGRFLPPRATSLPLPVSKA